MIAASTDGASVLQLCKLGDDSILAETSAVFTKKVDGKILDKGHLECYEMRQHTIEIIFFYSGGCWVHK